MITQKAQTSHRIARHETEDLVRHEMLLHDVYDLPAELEEEVTALRVNGHVLCTCCGGTGNDVGTVRHEAWCVYTNGPVSPLLPN